MSFIDDIRSVIIRCNLGTSFRYGDSMNKNCSDEAMSFSNSEDIAVVVINDAMLDWGFVNAT